MMAVNKNGEKKKLSVFWILYLIFAAALVVFWVVLTSYVRKCIVEYDRSLPEKKMDEILTKLQQNGLEQYLVVNGKISRFETMEDYISDFKSRTAGKELSYVPSAGFQDHTPMYELRIGSEQIGTVTLKEASSRQMMLLLTVSTWETDEIIVPVSQGNESVTITVPDSYHVYLNGQEMSQAELPEEGKIPKEFSFSAEYVEVPKMVTYCVDGLIREPAVEITDGNGEKTDFETRKNANELIVNADFMESPMPEELSKMVLEHAERYSNYFSRDLPGTYASVAPIADIFPKDSYYLVLADNYRREDMWMYSHHTAPVFKNEKVTNYIRYSDVFFSSEVYFEKDMYLETVKTMRTDVTHSVFYYGLIDGEWKVLDIRTCVDET